MENIQIEHYKDGIDFINVINNDLKVVFSSYGASIYSLRMNDEPLAMEIEDKDTFLASPQFFGKTLGIVAGRIPSFVEIENEKYHLLEDGDNPFCLHGGKLNSLSFKIWKYEIKDLKNKIDIIFKINPRKKLNGFPGKSTIKVIYSLIKNKNVLKIRFLAKAKETSLVNLSNHLYWNFGDLNLNDYKLKFNAPYIGKNREDLLIVDKMETPSYLDFSALRKLKKPLDEAKKTSLTTIDNTFLFDQNEDKHTLLFKNDKYELKMKTNYEAMNIYVDSSLTPLKFKNHPDLKERRAIAFEPQKFVLDLNNIILKNGQKYDYFIEYTFKRRK